MWCRSVEGEREHDPPRRWLLRVRRCSVSQLPGELSVRDLDTRSTRVGAAPVEDASACDGPGCPTETGEAAAHGGDPVRPPARSADFILIVANSLWGFNYVAVKFGLTEIHPLAFPVLRYGLGGIAMAVILRSRGGSLRVARADLKLLMVAAVFGVTLNQVCFVYSLSNTGATDVALLGATGPMLTALLATMVGVEKLGGRHSWGVFVGMAGTVLIVFGGAGAQSGHSTLLGDGLRHWRSSGHQRRGANDPPANAAVQRISHSGLPDANRECSAIALRPAVTGDTGLRTGVARGLGRCCIYGCAGGGRAEPPVFRWHLESGTLPYCDVLLPAIAPGYALCYGNTQRIGWLPPSDWGLTVIVGILVTRSRTLLVAGTSETARSYRGAPAGCGEATLKARMPIGMVAMRWAAAGRGAVTRWRAQHGERGGGEPPVGPR